MQEKISSQRQPRGRWSLVFFRRLLWSETRNCVQCQINDKSVFPGGSYSLDSSERVPLLKSKFGRTWMRNKSRSRGKELCTCETALHKILSCRASWWLEYKLNRLCFQKVLGPPTSKSSRAKICSSLWSKQFDVRLKIAAKFDSLRL